MVCVTNLTKRCGTRSAVDDLSFDVAAGRVTGFVGPNGAGKSATMRAMVGLPHGDVVHASSLLPGRIDMNTRSMRVTAPDDTYPRPGPHAVEVRGLAKAYDGRAVVDDVSFTVEEGEIFAILGPNGAGKTTTVESIAGLRTPDVGSVRVFGHDPVTDRTDVRDVLGVQLQASSFQNKLTAREIIDTYRGLYPDPLDTDELLDQLGLGPYAATRYAKLSGGQQQRVSIAVALVGRPRVVILDELTTGLDPRARRDTWGLVEDLRDGGVTVLLVTHFMEEAERLADRLALLDRGRLVALDTPAGLVGSAGLEQQLRFSTTSRFDEDWIRRLPEVSGVGRDRDEFIVTGDERMLFSVVSLLAAHDIVPGRLQVDQPTLDDAFLALAGRTLDDSQEVAR